MKTTKNWNFHTSKSLHLKLPLGLPLSSNVCGVSSGFVSILQALMLEDIPSQKCHTNTGPILNSYSDMGIFKVACASRCGHVQRQASIPVALQLEDNAVRCTVDSLNCEHAIYIFQWRICRYAFCLGFVVAVRLLLETVKSNFQHCFSVNVWYGIAGDQMFDYTSSHSVWQVTFVLDFSKWATGPLRGYSSADMITVALWAWLGHLLISLVMSCNIWMSSSLMDWLWHITELATVVTGSHSARFPYVGLHEKHGVWMQSGHKRGTSWTSWMW